MKPIITVVAGLAACLLAFPAQGQVVHTTATLSQGGGVVGVSVGNLALFAGGGALSVYDSTAGQWSAGAAPSVWATPAPAGGLALFADTNTSSAVVDAYDTGSGQWSSMTLAQDVGRSATTVGNEAVFADSTGNGVAMEIYNATSGQWSYRAFAGFYPAAEPDPAATAGGRVYYAPGWNDFSITTQTAYVYDPQANSWSTITYAPAPRMAVAVLAVGSKVLFAGGDGSPDPGSAGNDVEILDTTTMTWSHTTSPSPIEGRAPFTTYAAAGGMAFFQYDGAVQIYDTNTGEWSTATLSVPRYDAAAVSVGNEVIFAGGYLAGGAPSDAVDIYTVTPEPATLSLLALGGLALLRRRPRRAPPPLHGELARGSR
jgi:hypothetical protein